eukprot:TRINITY_DN2267_c1_g1_i1.p1 TRINITY_DN2267_c1_g1~~TRINITY_DN2267_c1_g1_i1.p1  ORF type:complete len:265 (+),score=68.21 TRINITY_DN2267_c1_g1_i1:77-871(+)
MNALVRTCGLRRALRSCAGGVQPREYYYYLNDHGHLFHLYNVDEFLAGKLPIGPAHLRDAKFLDFFFSRVSRNDDAATSTSFPWVSRCSAAGKPERNLLAASDRPVVFRELVEDFAVGDRVGLSPVGAAADGSENDPLSRAPGVVTAVSAGGVTVRADGEESVREAGHLRRTDGAGGAFLVYGSGAGRLRTPFNPEELRVCERGRIYYPHKIGGHGLLSCACAMRLGLEDIWEETGEPPELHWRGRKYPIDRIPAYPPPAVGAS